MMAIHHIPVDQRVSELIELNTWNPEIAPWTFLFRSHWWASRRTDELICSFVPTLASQKNPLLYESAKKAFLSYRACFELCDCSSYALSQLLPDCLRTLQTGHFVPYEALSWRVGSAWSAWPPRLHLYWLQVSIVPVFTAVWTSKIQVLLLAQRQNQ